MQFVFTKITNKKKDAHIVTFLVCTSVILCNMSNFALKNIMTIEEMLNRIGEELIGENAIIQIQSNGKSYVKVIGNSDKLTYSHP